MEKPAYTIQEVLPTISEVVGLLTDRDLKVEVCGAYRRGLPTIDRIDMVVSPPITAALACLQESETLVLSGASHSVKGSLVSRVKLAINDIDFMLYRAELEYWGAMTLHATGNMNFNIAIQARAKTLHYQLNRYGLWFHGDRIGGKTEEQIFYALDMEYIEPQQRNVNSRQETGGLFNVSSDWSENAESDDPEDNPEDGDGAEE